MKRRVFSVPIITDWVAFTPTGSWIANSTYTGRWRRLGDSMQVQVSVALAGAPTSATLTINTPNGYVIDTNKMAATSDYPVGTSAMVSAAASYNGTVIFNSTTSVRIHALLTSAAAAHSAQVVSQANPNTFANGDIVSADYMVPVAGWKANRSIS